MKIVIYDENYKVVNIMENIENPKVEKNNVEWDGGSATGFNLPFLLLDDNVNVEEYVNDDVIALDRKKEFKKTGIQQALDDLILGEISMMAGYMGQRIIDDAYTYDFVILKRPDLKEGIDQYLVSRKKEDLITH